MIQFNPQLLHGLEWGQNPAFHRRFELKAGDSVLASLDFLKTFGTLARGQTSEGVWTFKRTGFLSPLVTVRVEGSATDIAVYHPNFIASKGQLKLAAGEQLEFRPLNFWAREWALFDGQRREVLRFHNQGLLRHGAAVTVSAPERADIALLLLLCWYVIVLHMQDSAARAASS